MQSKEVSREYSLSFRARQYVGNSVVSSLPIVRYSVDVFVSPEAVAWSSNAAKVGRRFCSHAGGAVHPGRRDIPVYTDIMPSGIEWRLDDPAAGSASRRRGTNGP